MEIASLFRSLMVAFPGGEEFGHRKTDELEAVFDQFFKWEETVMVLGNPSEEEKKIHKDFVQSALKLIRLLRKVDATDEKLEMLQINLEDSEGAFYGLTKSEADKVLSVFDNER